MSLDEHRQMRIKKGDLVLLSSRFIPGNVLAITKVINRLYKLGAEVLYEKVQAIHASGHAHREELRIMLEAARPKYFVPIHGEYRHLVKHTRLAVECGVAPERAIVLEDGQPLTFLPLGIRLEDAVPAERILVDGKGVGDVGQSVLKERQLLAGEGMVVVLLVMDKETGKITLGPDIVSKGFVFEQQYAHLLEDAKCVVLEEVENAPKGNVKKLKERVRMALRRFFRTVLDRDPVVVPLVIAI
jgi:ribonuclease J